MNKKIAFIVFCLAIAACGKTANKETPEMLAALACDSEAKSRIGESPYQLDTAALAASAKRSEDGWELLAPITINAGLRDEEKQKLECKVRAQNDKAFEVMYINFIY